ncbi:MAG: hypothetical protein ACYDFT_03730 [Thermoplasmata archaeon]
MPEVVDDLSELKQGTHCLSLFTSRRESKEQAISFLAGAPTGQASSYWVADPSLKDYYSEDLASRAPEQVGCVHLLPGPQVTRVEGKLRPVPEIVEFVGAHPEGVTGAAETITEYWAPRNVPDHLEYESWFQEQPRGSSRFLCPYDLRRIPPEMAPETLRELGAHHTHVALSQSRDPAARVLQLFIFGYSEEVPAQLQGTLRWAEDSGWVQDRGPPTGLSLTASGEALLRGWSATLG